MNTIELSRLERQIDHLLQAINELRRDNQSLRQKLAKSIREKTVLLENNRKASHKINKVIEQLRESTA